MELSYQPEECSTRMRGAAYHWRLIDDFMEKIDEHHILYVSQSYIIFVDEGIS
jgi:hypothetical protein